MNLCAGLLHKNPRQLKGFPKETIDNLHLFLNYIKEVICGNCNEEYQNILKWTSNMCKGNKNISLIYLKSVEGTGKSTLTDFLRRFVVGNAISTVSNSEPSKSPNNKCLCGKLFVIFEELEVTDAHGHQSAQN